MQSPGRSIPAAPRTFTLRAHRPADTIDFAAELNEQQCAVATAPDGPMLVIAGAGSGKTRSLVCRLAWLIRQGIDPGRLLLMTFTNRAAREMVARVGLLVRQDASRIWCGTFHHVANRLLREHGSVLKLPPEFTILDREDAGDLLGVCVAEAKVSITATRFPDRNVLQSIASLVANTMEPIEVVLERRYPYFAGLAQPIAGVLDRYARRKRASDLVDYDDLLHLWLRLLEEHADVAAQIARRFDHVLVDEYQDTNAIQARIADLLVAPHRNLCVVGDDSQSIYSFRGAGVHTMLSFPRRYPEARDYRLEINYRSTPEILDLANASIALNEGRLPKTLRAVRPSGMRPALVPCEDHFVQSRFIAEYILHLLDQGRQVTDIAVLYRSHWHAMEIQLELQARNIPFQVRGGLRFFEQAHIKDVLSFLRLRHNGGDELAWQRVLRLAPRIGGALAQRLWSQLATSDDRLGAVRGAAAAAGLPPAARHGFAQLAAVLDDLGRRSSPAAMITAVLDGFYGDHLVSRYQDAELRRQDIESVAAFAAQYPGLEHFLSDIALTGDFTGETCVDGPEEQLFVTLSTVHQAKGLEWPVVLIPWVADGRFPTDMAMGTREELEEERRVFHVALTRAKDELYLVVPQVWSNHRRKRILMKPSRFVTELDAGLMETMVVSESRK